MRARNIKPGFFTNEDLGEVSIPARFLFSGLWCMADREGRLEDRPKRIKGEIFRFDSIEVEPLLKELSALQFIIRYEIEGKRFIWITKFSSHQSPHYQEKPSIIPPCPLEKSFDDDNKNPGKSFDDDNENPRQAPEKSSMKKGQISPDSLIPDSLIPDSNTTHPPKKKSAKTCEPFELPNDIPPFEWESWMQIRKKKRSPNTSHAKELLIKELRLISEKRGISIKNIIERAIMRNWTGVEDEWFKSYSPPEGKPYRCPDYEKADKVCYHDPENGKPDPRVTHPAYKDKPRCDWGDGRDMTTGHPKLVF